jgi:hypothetical protein
MKNELGVYRYALPFSSFPKYVVHFSFLASLPKNELLRHLLEQNQSIDPSFLINIIPVPDGNSLPQNEHLLGLGTVDVSFHFLFEGYLLIFLASLSVSLSINMSWTRTGPLTLRVMMRPLSFPSRILTRTWLISPVTPVRPIT